MKWLNLSLVLMSLGAANANERDRYSEASTILEKEKITFVFGDQVTIRAGTLESIEDGNVVQVDRSYCSKKAQKCYVVSLAATVFAAGEKFQRTLVSGIFGAEEDANLWLRSLQIKTLNRGKWVLKDQSLLMYPEAIKIQWMDEALDLSERTKTKNILTKIHLLTRLDASTSVTKYRESEHTGREILRDEQSQSQAEADWAHYVGPFVNQVLVMADYEK